MLRLTLRLLGTEYVHFNLAILAIIISYNKAEKTLMTLPILLIFVHCCGRCQQTMHALESESVVNCTVSNRWEMGRGALVHMEA